MEWLVAVVLGVTQGLTEFLPVSSSAHLRIVGEILMPGREPGAFFTAIVQIGTETAVLVYFWKDVTHIIATWFKSLVGKAERDDPAARMGWLIIIGSIPIGVLGLLFQDSIETVLRSLWITAIMLIVFAIVLAAADTYGAKNRQLEELTWKHGIVYGLFQALALIPGVSRSGGTITGGLIMGYSREAAARYSFLLAMPAVFASGFYGLFKAFEEPMTIGWGPTALATIAAFVVGYVVIAALLRYISNNSFMIFAYYRIILGVVLLILLGTGVLNPL